MSAFTMYDVFDEIDQLVYTFEGDEALAAWSLDGEQTFTAVRPATPADVVAPDELEALFALASPRVARATTKPGG